MGAHPGFPDLWGFGRRRMPFTPAEIERLVAYQVGAAQALACYAGHRITYVKAHGALANVAAEERPVADAIARAVRAVDRDLALLAIALTAQVQAGEACGLEVHQEIFADRGYTEAGLLIPRSQPGAMITDAGEAAAKSSDAAALARRPRPAHGRDGDDPNGRGQRPSDADPVDLRARGFGPCRGHRPRRTHPAGGGGRHAGAVPAVSDVPDEPRLLDAGEAALVVEFGTTVDPAISDRVLALDDALGAAPLAGPLERVPTYRSLMLHYDPLVLDRETLAARVRSLAAGATAFDGAIGARVGKNAAGRLLDGVQHNGAPA